MAARGTGEHSDVFKDSTDQREAIRPTRTITELARLARLTEGTGLATLYYEHISAANQERLGEHIVARTIASENHPVRNEDSLLAFESNGALVGAVFDGLGGHYGSERASRLAAGAADYQLHTLSEHMLPGEVTERQVAALTAANSAIADDIEHYDTRGIATTAVVASVHTDPESGQRFAAFTWIGDSRAYVLSGDTVVYVTLDDSMPPFITPERPYTQRELQDFLESVDVGNFPWDDAYLREVFRERNLVSGCLKGASEPGLHSDIVWLQKGDKVRVTSDGIHDNLTREQIGQAGNVDELVALALATSRDRDAFRGKPDDITAIEIEA